MSSIPAFENVKNTLAVPARACGSHVHVLGPTGFPLTPTRSADATGPFRAIDDPSRLRLLRDRSGSAAVQHRILFDNPAELFGF